MRHRVSGNRLSRSTNRRKALSRTLLSALFTYGRVTTTEAKAKAISQEVDRLINFVKEGTMTARRQAAKELPNLESLPKVREAALVFAGRTSGFARVIKLGERFSDSARMAVLELVSGPESAQTNPDPDAVPNAPPAKPQKETAAVQKTGRVKKPVKKA